MYYIDKRVEVNDAITMPDGRSVATMSSIVNYFQNCCLFQSEDLDVGIKYLTKERILWVLNSWQIDVERFPSYAEKIRIYTNPYSIKSFLGKRNFFIIDENEKIIAKADSTWTLLSMDTFKPVKAPDKIINAYDYEEKLDMEYASRKIIIPDNSIEKDPVKILPTHLDMNMHVNNGQYIAIASQSLPKDFMPHHLRSEYKSQVRLGEVLTPFVANVNDETYVITLKDSNLNIVTVIEYRA